MPPHNKALLLCLLDLIAVVAAHQEENKMTPSNLSIVFAPSLFRSPSESLQQMMVHSPMVNSIFRMMILHHQEIVSVLRKVV
jgi:hypothetical protein